MLIQNSNFFNILSFISIIFCVSCKDKATTTAYATNPKIETTPGIATNYEIQAQESYTLWTIPIEQKTYKIRIPVTYGRIAVLDSVITTGDFDLDIKNLIFENSSADEQQLLNAKLQDSTFFNTNITPLGRLIISKIEKKPLKSNNTHQISFDVTLNNHTRTLNIPANISFQNNCINLNTTPININLIDWDITAIPQNAPNSTLYIQAILCHKR